MWDGMDVVVIGMGGFEAVDGDSVIAAVHVDGEVFISSFDEWVPSIVWWLK